MYYKFLTRAQILSVHPFIKLLASPFFRKGTEGVANQQLKPPLSPFTPRAPSKKGGGNKTDIYGWSPVSVVLLLFTMFFTMSGCSLIQPSVTADPVLHKSLYNFPQVWTMSGRISVISGNENWYAKFNWVQEKEDFQISFTGPFGETELQLSQTAQKIVLKTPSSELTSDNLEQLLLQKTGWKFPVTSLRYWSYGAPNPDMPAKAKYNEQQQITELEQLGWHIQYPKRMPVGEYLLPKKIIVIEQDIKIKIVVTKWEFPLQKKNN